MCQNDGVWAALGARSKASASQAHIPGAEENGGHGLGCKRILLSWRYTAPRHLQVCGLRADCCEAT